MVVKTIKETVWFYIRKINKKKAKPHILFAFYRTLYSLEVNFEIGTKTWRYFTEMRLSHGESEMSQIPFPRNRSWRGRTTEFPEVKTQAGEALAAEGAFCQHLRHASTSWCPWKRRSVQKQKQVGLAVSHVCQERVLGKVTEDKWPPEQTRQLGHLGHPRLLCGQLSYGVCTWWEGLGRVILIYSVLVSWSF